MCDRAQRIRDDGAGFKICASTSMLIGSLPCAQTPESGKGLGALRDDPISLSECRATHDVTKVAVSGCRPKHRLPARSLRTTRNAPRRIAGSLGAPPSGTAFASCASCRVMTNARRRLQRHCQCGLGGPCSNRERKPRPQRCQLVQATGDRWTPDRGASL